MKTYKGYRVTYDPTTDLPIAGEDMELSESDIRNIVWVKNNLYRIDKKGGDILGLGKETVYMTITEVTEEEEETADETGEDTTDSGTDEAADGEAEGDEGKSASGAEEESEGTDESVE